MPLDEATLKEIFTYHAPDREDLVKYESIRQSALVFARVILEFTPRCADQTTAIRHIRDAVMTANSAVALKGLI